MWCISDSLLSSSYEAVWNWTTSATSLVAPGIAWIPDEKEYRSLLFEKEYCSLFFEKARERFSLITSGTSPGRCNQNPNQLNNTTFDQCCQRWNIQLYHIKIAHNKYFYFDTNFETSMVSAGIIVRFNAMHACSAHCTDGLLPSPIKMFLFHRFSFWLCKYFTSENPCVSFPICICICHLWQSPCVFPLSSLKIKWLVLHLDSPNITKRQFRWWTD